MVFLPSDVTYFKDFSIPLAQSIWEFAPKAAIHFHVVTNAPDQGGVLDAFLDPLKNKNIRVTIEILSSLASTPTPTGARCYYHAIRLIRLYQFLRDAHHAMWMLDVDALANRDLTTIFPKLEDVDLGLRTRPGRLEPWHQFSACLVAARPHPRA